MNRKFTNGILLGALLVALMPCHGAQIKLVNPRWDGDFIYFSFQSQTGQKYVLEGKAVLDSGTWSPLTTYIGSGGLIEVSDPVNGESAKFYRVTQKMGVAAFGKVTLAGDPPPEIQIRFDPSCGRLHSVDATTRFYVVGPEKGLAEVFVYITQGLEGQSFSPATTPVLIDQVGCLYTPYVSGVQVGQKLVIRNSDLLLHNVHVVPTATGNRESNRAQLAKAKDFEYSFTTPEVFLRIKCEVHPWQFAYVGVVAHPFFAVTDANGNFELPAGLPTGTYTLEAYHRKAGKASQVFTLGAGGTIEVNFTLNVPN